MNESIFWLIIYAVNARGGMYIKITIKVEVEEESHNGSGDHTLAWAHWLW